MPNFVKINRLVAKILRFFSLSRWRPSAIWDSFGHILTTDSDYLGVSITLQNLVMIDAVVFSRASCTLRDATEVVTFLSVTKKNVRKHGKGNALGVAFP